jgi:hypothetical protein
VPVHLAAGASLRLIAHALRGYIAESLKTLTGQDLPPDGEAWRVWWKANRGTFK